jgi:cellulose synthase/poly-beta-1,6-N-acetylglucosamine synthase-like glycosyltransferase
LIFYIYFGYLFVLFLISLFKKNKNNTSDIYLPSVSIIVAAYNEEKVIEDKIKNTLNLDYPQDKLEVIVFSDSSTDQTDEIVKKYSKEGVNLLRIEGRKGKTYCQNRAVEEAKGEIIVFSDANSIYQRQAIKKLVRNFSDEQVGCVSGELKYYNKKDLNGESSVQGEGVYWSYEQKLKKMESQISSVVAANGSVYALRKKDYIPLQNEANSDFAEPLKLLLKGYRIIYEPEAFAFENTADNWREEYTRRVRIVTGTFDNFIGDRELHSILNPFNFGIFSLQFFSHKLLRWFSGLFLLFLLVSSLILYNQAVFYQFIFWGQIFFYSLALYGLLAEVFSKMINLKIPHVLFYFCLSCWAMLIGVYNAIRGNHIITWEVKR